MGACASRGDDSKPSFKASSFSKSKDLSFTFEDRTVTTTVTKSRSLDDLNAFLLSAFNLDESMVVTGVLVTVTGPLMPFFMLPYLHANTARDPYRIVVAPAKDYAINNWGCAPDEQEQADATVEWSEIESLTDSDLYSSPTVAARLFHLLRRYGYIRLHLPATSPHPATFQSATTAAHEFFAKSEAEKRKRFLGFHQQKFVGFSHAEGSARQFIQLRTTRRRITTTEKSVPVFDESLTRAYLTLQDIAYRLFKLMCHPELTPQTHLSPELYSSLLDAPCKSLESFNECVSVPRYQFVGTNVFRVYQYLREIGSREAQLPGFLGAATTVHSDMGLLTVSPHSNLPGLTVLKHSDATRWVNVEMKPGSRCVDGSDLEKNYVFVFAGETMAQLTKGYLLAPLHFVDERTPTHPRFSMPFFLRARQNAVLPAVEGSFDEMTVEDFMTKTLHRQKQVWGHKPNTDF
jgi:isopenicillin N synthase-like dioxygenase